jgi:anti-sigma factor RsiW
MNRSENHRKDEHLSYLLTAYAFESLSDAGRLEVERHLASCTACRAELEEIRGTVSSVRGAYPEDAGGGASTFEARKLERVLAAAHSRRRGRIRWMAWPIGAAAAALFVVLVIGSVTGVRYRARGAMSPSERAQTLAIHEFAGEELQEGQAGPSSGATRPTAPPAAAAQAPPAGEPTQETNDRSEVKTLAQSLELSKIRGAESRRLRSVELQSGGVYRETLQSSGGMNPLRQGRKVAVSLRDPVSRRRRPPKLHPLPQSPRRWPRRTIPPGMRMGAARPCRPTAGAEGLAGERSAKPRNTSGPS